MEEPTPAAGDGSQWRVRWATSTDLDPRQCLSVRVGAVTALAWAVIGERPVLAAATSADGGTPGSAPAYELRLWDVLSGDSQLLPGNEAVQRLAFASAADETWLVSGHRHGLVRIWGERGRALRMTLDTGNDHLRDLVVAQTRSGTTVVTLDVRGRVQRWSLTTGARLSAVDAPKTFSICGGTLADGRQVLLTAGDGLSLWDLDDGRALPFSAPPDLGRVVRVALSATNGRDRLTVVDEFQTIRTFDPSTGRWIGSPITAHAGGGSDDLTAMVRDQNQLPQLAAVAGTLAVPTKWRVRLWNQETAQEEAAPIAGPVAGALVQQVSWQGRPMLLSGSPHDGVVAVWDLNRPATRPVGHDERVTRVSLADRADVVVSADDGGTVAARALGDGRLVSTPTATGRTGLRALAAWLEDGAVIAATGAGSHRAADGDLHWWNLTSGEPFRAPTRAHTTYLHWMSLISLPNGPALVTFGTDGVFKLWHPTDGTLLAAGASGLRSKLTGFATGLLNDRPAAALSSLGQPLRIHFLDDLAAPATIIPEAGHDVVLTMTGSRIITGHTEDRYSEPTSVRTWTPPGIQAGHELHGTTTVIAAAVHSWPAVYIARADSTISLTDLETGRDLCAPLPLRSRPSSLAATADGDLIVGFGSDVARVAPPTA